MIGNDGDLCIAGKSISNTLFREYCDGCEKRDQCILCDTSKKGEDCLHYGNRGLDYPKCQPCKEDICLACSMLTLETVLSGSSRNIEAITPHGKVVRLKEDLR